MPLCVSVYICLVVTCWERADLLWCLTVSLLLSHWYLGSGVVFDYQFMIFAPLLTLAIPKVQVGEGCGSRLIVVTNDWCIISSTFIYSLGCTSSTENLVSATKKMYSLQTQNMTSADILLTLFQSTFPRNHQFLYQTTSFIGLMISLTIYK